MFFQGGDAHFVISIEKYVQKQEFPYSKNQKVSKINYNMSKIGGIPKTQQKYKSQGKNSRLGRISPCLRD